LAIPKTEKEKIFSRKTQKKLFFCFQKRKTGENSKKTSHLGKRPNGMFF